MTAYQAAIPNSDSTGKVWTDLEQMNDTLLDLLTYTLLDLLTYTHSDLILNLVVLCLVSCLFCERYFCVRTTHIRPVNAGV